MFKNIEAFYLQYHQQLIEDKSEGSLRPGKSFTKDIENCIDKFKQFYQSTGFSTINEKRLTSIIGAVDTNTRSQNLRVMREFSFLVERDTPDQDGARFELTPSFVNFVSSGVSAKDYVLAELKSLSSLKDFTMYLNLLLCTLREAYLYGQVMLFRDSIDKFKADVPNADKRFEYRQRIFDVYGYSGRDKQTTDDVYSPNLSYMSRAELENLGLLIMTTQKIDNMNNLVLTKKGYEILQQIDSNLSSAISTEYLISSHVEDFDYSITKNASINKIYYGVPGCGKSYHIEHNILGKDKETKKYLGDYDKDNIIRTTFYQDYSNTDFVGQILPKIIKGENGEKDTVEYIFNPGPFTLALIQAISNPDKKVALVIEEINRGNAPAIFGDIFQLLDRDDNSISEYGIVNVSMRDYLNAYEFDVDGEKKRYIFKDIKIPGNMDIFATMNTSDQNVYTLDTAFTRRWAKERIDNNFNGNDIANFLVPGMEPYTWGMFFDAINNQIQNKLDDLQVNEDKQVGAFFVKKSDLLAVDNTLNDADKKAKARSFAHKVLEYLWDDVSKLDHSVIFNSIYKTFEKVVEDYLEKGVAVFNSEIFKNEPIQETVKNTD